MTKMSLDDAIDSVFSEESDEDQQRGLISLDEAIEREFGVPAGKRQGELISLDEAIEKEFGVRQQQLPELGDEPTPVRQEGNNAPIDLSGMEQDPTNVGRAAGNAYAQYRKQQGEMDQKDAGVLSYDIGKAQTVPLHEISKIRGMTPGEQQLALSARVAESEGDSEEAKRLWDALRGRQQALELSGNKLVREGESRYVKYQQPESELWKQVLNTVESSGMTVASGLRSGAAWALGGPALGGLMSLLNTGTEASTEAGGAYAEGKRRGMSSEQLRDVAEKTQDRNVALLLASNLLGDWATFGIDKGLGKLAQRITGKGILSSLARGMVQKGVPYVAGSFPEGGEEFGQEIITQTALGDAPDYQKALEAAKAGVAGGLLYPLVGRGTMGMIDMAMRGSGTKNVDDAGETPSPIQTPPKKDISQAKNFDEIQDILESTSTENESFSVEDMPDAQDNGPVVLKGDALPTTVIGGDTAPKAPVINVSPVESGTPLKVDGAVTPVASVGQAQKPQSPGGILASLMSDKIDAAPAIAPEQTPQTQVLEPEVVTDTIGVGDYAKQINSAPDDKARSAIFLQEGFALFPDLRPEDQMAAGRNAYLVAQGVMSQKEADALAASAIFTGVWKRKESPSDAPQTTQPKEAPAKPEQIVVDEAFLNKVVESISKGTQASVRDLQKALGIGFTKAQTALEALERQGIVGPVGEDGRRQVLASAPVAPKTEDPAKPGKDGVVRYRENGELKEAPVRYEIVEADTLKTSWDEGYPQEFQPRDTDKAISDYRVGTMAADLKAELLGFDDFPDRGAPTTREDGVIIAGNHRKRAADRAYDAQTEGAAKYREYLAGPVAQELGDDPERIRGMKKPILRRRLLDDSVNLRAFAEDANASVVGDLGASEQAKMDSDKISDAMLDTFDVDDAGTITRDFVESFAKNIVRGTEMGRFLDKDGRLSQDGIRRIRNALVTRAYGDPALVGRISESTDDNAKRISNGLMAAAPVIARMEGRIEKGLLNPLSIKKDLMAAVTLVHTARSEGKNIEEYLTEQTGLFDGQGHSDETKALARFLYGSKASTKAVREFLTRYAQNVERLGAPNEQALPGAEAVVPTKRDLVSRLLGVQTEGQRESAGLFDGVDEKPVKRPDKQAVAKIREEIRNKTKAQIRAEYGDEIAAKNGLDATANAIAEKATNGLAADLAEEPKENQTPESKTKREPWQMTREEYSYVKNQRGRRLRPGESSTDDDWRIDEKRWSEHKEIVRRALNEGKDVPANVLSAYPDLVKEKELKPDKASREPWQMTRNEYELDTAASAGGVPGIDARAAKRHENIVKLALIEGKPVPEHVLKDYPELAKHEGDAMNPQSDIMKEFGKRFGNLDVGGPNVIPDTIAKVAADKAYRNAMKNNDRKTAQIEHKAALERVVVTMFPDQVKFFRQFQDNPAFRKWFTETSFNATYEPGAVEKSSERDMKRDVSAVVQSKQKPVVKPEASVDDERGNDAGDAEPLADVLPEGVPETREGTGVGGSDGVRGADEIRDERDQDGQSGDGGRGSVGGSQEPVLHDASAGDTGRDAAGRGTAEDAEKPGVPLVGVDSGTSTESGSVESVYKGELQEEGSESEEEQPVERDPHPQSIREGGKPSKIAGENPGNFVITESLGLGEGTDGEKIARNLAAIRTLRTLQKENRYPTREEQAIMARYVGWGGLKPVFDVKNKDANNMYGKAQRVLQSLLSENEYQDAFNSTSDAHYTAKGVVDAMWRVVRHMGFKGGRALEPTVGTGNFLGLQPADMAASTEWHASELDTITGQLAAMLYPDANILASTGFQHAPFADESFDLVIGNPPFGGSGSTISTRNPRYKNLNGMKIHNYIIAKAGRHLRPGGVLTVVVTHRFLDTADAEARDVLAKEFKFLGAFRLPNDAFAKNAGTKVVTDVIILQKLRPGEAADTNTSWLNVNGKLENGIRVNKYYQEHPTHILGTSTMGGHMQRIGEPEYTVESDGRDLGQAIDGLIAGDFADLAGVMAATPADRNTAAAMLAQSSLPIGGMVLEEDGRIVRRDMNDEDGNAVVDEVTPDSLWKDSAEEWKAIVDVIEDLKNAAKMSVQEIETAQEMLASLSSIAYNADGSKKTDPTIAEKAVYTIRDALDSLGVAFHWEFSKEAEEIAKTLQRKKLGNDGYARLKGMLRIRGIVLDLHAAERSDRKDMGRLRKRLNAEYDAFVKKYGYISDPKNFNLLGGDVGPESGLELDFRKAVTADRSKKTGIPVAPASAKKADIFTKRINYPVKVIDHANSADDALKIALSERGRPDIGYMAQLTGKTQDEIIDELTGGEHPQLFFNPETGSYEHADDYLSGNVKHKLSIAQASGIEANVRALEQVQPAPKTKAQIRPNIRGAWIPSDIFKSFLSALGVRSPNVLIIPSIGKITADGYDGSLSTFGMQFTDSDRGVVEIFNAAASGKTITITRPTGDGGSVKDDAATIRVNALVNRMAQVFEEWAYSDDVRSGQIVTAFNEKMNTHVSRQYDGVKYLHTVGANPSISLRQTQKNASWRMIQSKAVLLDHVVGAGKTFTIVAGVMERKRLGLSKKPLIVVPNHLVTQWAQDFYRLYPAARILAATPADFTAKNRRRLFARIATGDFDAVIIGHSSLGFMETPIEDQRGIIDEQLTILRNALDRAREDGESKRTISQIAQRIKKYEEKLDNLATRQQDEIGIDFKALGVDYIAVDESHEFKNLEYVTTADRVVGMNDPVGSKKAFDLYTKIRGLQSRGGAVTFATGTPVSNSLIELYTVMKYLAHDDLVARDQLFYDAWAGAYTNTEERLEYTPTQKLKFRRVLSGLSNLSSLRQLYETFADIITMEDLKRIYTGEMEERNRKDGTNLRTNFPIPAVDGGGRRLDNGAITEAQQEYMDYLVARMEAIQQHAGDKEYSKRDNALWVLSDARKMSLDIRTINPGLPRDANGKVMRSARNIKAIYDEWNHKRGTQLVFCDLSTPSKAARSGASKIINDALKVICDTEGQKRFKNLWGHESLQNQWRMVLEIAEGLMEADAVSESKKEQIERYLSALEDVEATLSVADSGFSVYDDLRQVLIDSGIPETEIAFIHDFNTPQQKQDLFDRVNKGYVRVLIGSSAKMGAGMNAQERLVALHHLDAPWRPSDIWQREGRIIRQGNELYWENPDGFRVKIIAYSTNGTSDTVMWQILERKAAAIEQFRQGSEIDEVVEENSDSDQYAEFMATSTGNPVFRLKMEAERKYRELDAKIGGLLMAQNNATDFLKEYESRKRRLEEQLKAWKSIQLDDRIVSEYATALADAQRKYAEEKAVYQVEQEKAAAAQREWEKQPKETRGKAPTLPYPPKVVSILSPSIQAASKYAANVRKTLERLAETKGTARADIPFGNATVHVEKSDGTDNTDFVPSWNVMVVAPGGDFFEVGDSSHAKNPLQATRLLDALTPARIQFTLKGRIGNAESALSSLFNQKGKYESVVGEKISVEARDEAKAEMDWYATQVRFAEIEADIERGKRSNRFIAADTRRPLRQSAQHEIKPWETTIDGETYAATGVRSSTRTYTYHQAVRESDNTPVVLMEKDHNPDKPAVYEVQEQPKSLRKENVSYRLAKNTDAEYMQAVERGDMETAQRMVDEAAEKAGFSAWKLWHGSKKAGHTIFDLFFAGKSGGQNLGVGVYFSEGKKWASVFAGRLLSDPEKDAKKKGIWYEYDDGGGVIAVYGPNIRKILDLGRDPKDRKDLRGALKRRLGANPDNPSDITEKARALGYEGIASIEGTDYQVVIFDTTKIKSADPVTYDDNGNVIPLSQRFNAGNEDIRYAVGMQNSEHPVTLEGLRRSVPGAKVTDLGDGKYRIDLHNGESITISTVGEIEMDPDVVRRDYGREPGSGEVVAGASRTIDGGRFIDLVEGIAGEGTLDHEIFETARSMVLTSEEKEILNNEIGSTEAQAEAYREFQANRKGAMTGRIVRVFQKIKDFFGAIRARLFGKKSLDVFREIAQGKVWERKTEVKNNIQTQYSLTQKPSGAPQEWEPVAKGLDRVVAPERRKMSFVERIQAARHWWQVEMMDDISPIRDYFGEDIYIKTTNAIHGINSRAQALIEFGDKAKGVKSLFDIFGAIPQNEHEGLMHYAVYKHLLDIAGSSEGAERLAAPLARLAKEATDKAKELETTLPKDEFHHRDLLDSAKVYRELARDYEEQVKGLTQQIKVTKAKEAQYRAAILRMDQLYPSWAGAQRDLVKYSRHLLGKLQDAGVVSNDLFTLLTQKYPNYIPLQRDFGTEEGVASFVKTRGLVNLASPLKRLKGSKRDVLDPLLQIISNTYVVESLVGKQNAAQDIAEMADRAELLGLVEPTTDRHHGPDEYVFHVWENGKRKFYTTTPDIYAALVMSSGSPKDSVLTKILSAPVKVLRAGVTHGVGFILRNPIRDTINAGVVGEHFTPVIDSLKGMFHVWKQDEAFQEFMKSGAMQGLAYMSEKSRKDMAAKIRLGRGKTRLLKEMKHPIAAVWNALGSAAELTELGTRVGQYQKMRDRGESMERSAFVSRDLIDYLRGGRTSKMITKFNPFFNAQIQGVAKGLRSFYHDGKIDTGTIARAMLYITLPSMLTCFWNLGGDDDRRKKYLSIPAWQRNLFWNIVVGKGEDAWVIKIPKPFDLGVVFGSIPERFVDYLYAEDKRAFKGIGTSLFNALSPEVAPLFMGLPFELNANYSMFYERGIVPMGQEKLEPKLQYGAYTAEWAKWAGEKFNLSPRKLEYAVLQLTGNLGKETSNLADMAFRAVTEETRPAREWYQQTPGVSAFVVPAKSMKRWEQTFQDEHEELNTLYKSAKQIYENSGSKALTVQERRILGAENGVRQVNQLFTNKGGIDDLRREISKVTIAKGMSAEEKRARVDRLEAKINDLSERGLAYIDKIKKSMNRGG